MKNSLMPYSEQRWGWWLLVGLVLYFSLQVIIRATGAITLELDEAEQLVLTQWWLAGYSGQPPLYSWIQGAIFQVMGTNLWALSLFKNLLLLGTYVFVFLSARRLLGDDRIAVVATLSLFLFPQISWESQRDLTHSVLVTALASASFYVILRWLDRPTIGHYLLVGCLFGLGVLAKYNFLVFAAAMGLVLFSSVQGRAVLLHPRILLTIAMALIVTLPHGVWLWQSQDPGGQVLEQLEFRDDYWFWSGLSAMLLAVIAFLAPWLLVMTIIFRSDFLRAWLVHKSDPMVFPIQRYPWIVLAVLTLIALLGVAGFKDRWMLPFLFIFPVVIFTAMKASDFTPRRVHAYIASCLLLPFLALILMSARVHFWPIHDSYVHRHFYPFDQWVSEIQDQGFIKGLIVSDWSFLAGNLRFHLPQSAAMTVGVNASGLYCSDGDDLLVVWDATDQAEMPQRLKIWLNIHLQVAPENQEPLVLVNDSGPDWRLGVLFLPGALDMECKMMGAEF